MFNFPWLPLLLVYNPRVATISFDQKRERGFDEQLVHILKFKQKYWAPLVGENVGNYNHVLTPAVDRL